MAKLVEDLFKVKVSTKGQVVIPKRVREVLGINQGDELLLVPTEEGIVMKLPAREAPPTLRGILRGLDVDIVECEEILREARRSLAKHVEGG